MRHLPEILCAVVTLCLSYVCAGPIKAPIAAEDKKSAGLADTVNDQELALENLAELAAGNLQNIAVQKQKSYQYSNVNGKEQSNTKTEEKILDPLKNDVVLDVKENTKSNNEDGKPHEEKVEHIDIPAVGLHKDIVSNGDNTETNDAIDENEPISSQENDVIRFTPAAIAEYLLQTGDFEEFEKALRELENSSGMSHAEAEDYKNSVRDEYNRLYQEAEAQAQSQAAIESFYPETLSNEDTPTGYDILPNGFYNMYNDDSQLPVFDMAELENEAELSDAIAEKQTLNALIKDLMDEWLSRAVLTGDREAGAMLNNIMSVVSRDQDPDDFKQVRQILTDLFADEVLQGLQPRQEIPVDFDELMDTQYIQPVPQPIMNETEESEENTEENDTTQNETESSDKTDNTEDEDSKENASSENKTEPSKEDMDKLKM